MTQQLPIMRLLAASALALLLGACSEPSTPEATQTESPAATSEQADISITAPTGTYRIDPHHSHISFSVNHLGLSNYIARFTEYDSTLQLDAENPANSSVTATIDPTSVRTDHDGDYKATHEDSPYDSWDEDLAHSPKFFNADEYPGITYRSNRVEVLGPDSFRVHGDLSLLGQTHPVVLNARIVGDTVAHPMSGNGAIGFSATGQLQRSKFGMTHLLDPELVGNAVTIRFEGEYQQVVPEAPAPDDNTDSGDDAAQ